ncbi:hypothetical protein Bbelb_390460 [Branchiostoma belcheri]|nr:hypothetical protein Bbelb_390460 [Branchiostoma belcheri]
MCWANPILKMSVVGAETKCAAAAHESFQGRSISLSSVVLKKAKRMLECHLSGTIPTGAEDTPGSRCLGDDNTYTLAGCGERDNALDWTAISQISIPSLPSVFRLFPSIPVEFYPLLVSPDRGLPLSTKRGASSAPGTKSREQLQCAFMLGASEGRLHGFWSRYLNMIKYAETRVPEEIRRAPCSPAGEAMAPTDAGSIPEKKALSYAYVRSQLGILGTSAANFPSELRMRL